MLGADGGNAPLGPLAPSTNPTELAKGQSARCMVSAGGAVYWQNADGLVVGAPRAGGPLETSHFRTPLAESPRCGIAVDGDTLYTTSYALGKVVELSLRSNGEWVIGASGTMFGALTTPSSLALAGDAIVVTELEGGRVTRLPRTRAAAVVLAEGLVRPDDVLVLDDRRGSFAYFVERGTAGGNDGAIKRVPTSGDSPVETLASGLADPHGLGAIDGRLYFLQGRGLASIPVDGGTPTVRVSDLASVGSLAVDGQSAYFYWRGGIAKAPAGAGGAATIYPGTSIPVALAVDDGRLFWADGASVWSATK